MASPTVTLVIATLEAARSEFSPIPDVIVSSPVDVERHLEAIGTNLDGSFLNVHSCANNGSGLCPNHAVKKCQACLLVQYCSKECQLSDWSRHKRDCRLARFIKHDVCPEVERPSPERFLLSTKESWSRLAWPNTSALTESLESELNSLHTLYSPESRHVPDITAGKKYLWGTTPPLDILNLAPNEGSNYDKPVVLNFRGADDLRHVMKTIVSLPENYTSPITSLIYETDMDLQIRNIIILMLALHYPDGQAAEFITHLWYSASIPCKMYLVLMDKILPCLKDIVESLDGQSDIESAKKVVVGTSSLEMVLTTGQFKELFDRLYPIGLETLANAETKRWSTMHTIQPIINAKIRQWLHNLPPWHRMTEENYRHTGILLPHGTPIHPLRTPNPTFYDEASEVLLHLFASPLDNHDLLRLRETCNRLGLPPNDLHGAAFFETKELVAAFCSRLAKMTVEFLITTQEIRCGREMGGNDLSDHSTSTTGSESASEATTANAEDVALRRNSAQKFLYDRILVSNLTGKLDEYDTKDKLSNLALILKPQGENPHAAVLALLTSATESGHIRSSDLLNNSRYITRLLPHKWHVYSGKAYQKALEQKLGSVNELRKSELALMETQDREFFATYLEYKEVLASANDVGLMMVSEDDMTITPAWPYRLEMHGSEKEQEKQFELRFTSKMKGCERLVMFKAIPGWKPRKHRDSVDWDCIFAEAARREENTKEDREKQLRLGKYEKYALAVCWK